MSGFPFVNKDLGIRRLVADLSGQAAVILMRVRQDNSFYVLETQSMARKSLSKSVFSLRRFWANVDQRDRIFSDQIDIYVTDIKWCWYRYRNDSH